LREIIAWQDANGYPPSFATEVSAGALCDGYSDLMRDYIDRKR
jgi:hypothetical protein